MKNPDQEGQKTVVSTADLAAKLGLSRWAISRALNGRGGVSKATRERVQAALREHHFEPDPLARGLRGGPTGLVGVCFPRHLLDGSRLNHEGLHPQAACGAINSLYKRLSERGLFSITSIHGSPEEETASLRRLSGLRVEAVILIAPEIGQKPTEWKSLFSAKRVCVAIDPVGELPCTTLKFDRLQAARLIVNHLHQLGHKRLALLGMHPNGRQAHAMAATCTAAGLSVRSHLRVMHLDDIQTIPTGGSAFGWALADTLLRRKASATGLVAADDQVAAGALARLQHEGRVVPRDFSVVGFGNHECGGYCNPPLATIDLQASRLFERAADTLCEQMNAAGQIETQEILINPLFLKRGSTAHPTSNR